MNRGLALFAKLAIATLLLIWVGNQVAWEDGLLEGREPGVESVVVPGMKSLLAAIDFGWFALGAGLWATLLTLSALRWKLLLHAVDVPTRFGHALRLVLAGTFFNNLMLGTTGGDLMRAVMVTRGLDEKRWRAALSVGVDRLTGLFTLLVLATVALLLARDDPRLGHLKILRYLTVAAAATTLAMVVFCTAYLSGALRGRLQRIGWLRGRTLPLALRRADEALTIYNKRPRAVLAALLVSLPLQTAGVLAFWAFGRALLSPLHALDSFVMFPAVQAASAVPLAPAGWGVGESLYGWFHARILGGPAWFTLGVAVSVLFRLTTQVGFGLVGGAVWALTKGGARATHQES